MKPPQQVLYYCPYDYDTAQKIVSDYLLLNTFMRKPTDTLHDCETINDAWKEAA